MTDRIIDFLRRLPSDGPCLVIDLEVVRRKYLAFAKSLPDTRVFYSVKANPDSRIIALLAELGSCFDAASVAEIDLVMAAGVTPDRISFGNTIKKERDIARAYQLGIRLYAVDAIEEVEKIARVAPGSMVMCRILCDGSGADWPLSRKFGCEPEMVPDILEHAHRLGLDAYGVSFHVGSQQRKLDAWDSCLKQSAAIFRTMAERGIYLKLVNLGGGFPARYTEDVSCDQSYCKSITSSIRRHFGNQIPETIIEPGRGMVGDAGIIKSEVVLISKKSTEDNVRWVYLDIGKFGGLAETIDESIRYQITRCGDIDDINVINGDDSKEVAPCVLAGPTCDSMDVLYEKNPYYLPVSLAIGDSVLIHGTGAYTASYSSVAFNGFPPLRTYAI